jgi:hypothetical protein
VSSLDLYVLTAVFCVSCSTLTRTSNLTLKSAHLKGDSLNCFPTVVQLTLSLKNGHKVKLLGLSATPDRTDGYDISNAFAFRAHEVDIGELMRLGKWVSGCEPDRCLRCEADVADSPKYCTPR